MNKYILIVLCIIHTPSSISGTLCGSDSSSLNKIYKDLSSDWWPSLSGIEALALAPLACKIHGEAYFGDGCLAHDACYDGLVNPGFSRKDCDATLEQSWIAECNDEYSGDGWASIITEGACRVSCVETAKAMSGIQTNAFDAAETAWDAAEATRNSNIDNLTIQKYISIINRKPSESELVAARDLIYQDKSIAGLEFFLIKREEDMQSVLTVFSSFFLLD